jgi:tripeptide aminopeptidase
MIDEQRLLDSFLEMVRIPSLSRKEDEFLAWLKRRFDELGFHYETDNASQAVGGEADNLVVYIPGNRPEAPTLMFSAHMDTVAPGEGIEPVVEGDRISSKGETILGADDKSGVAAILELARVIRERDIPRGDIELVFTICEEVGLQGARNLDRSLVNARYGFVLDGEDIHAATTKAPAAVRYEAVIRGRESHAGVAPEKGINAIALMAKAIAGMPNGRSDEETTCNIGVIEGGRGPNVVAPTARVIGEVRSRDNAKLEKLRDGIFDAYRGVIRGVSVESNGKRYEAATEIKIINSYPNMNVPDDAYSVGLVRRVLEGWGREFRTVASGGGTDANLHNGAGIESIIIGTGMSAIHSADEHILLSDIAAAARLILGIVEANAGA